RQPLGDIRAGWRGDGSLGAGSGKWSGHEFAAIIAELRVGSSHETGLAAGRTGSAVVAADQVRQLAVTGNAHAGAVRMRAGGKGISHDRVLATIRDVNGCVPCGPGRAADEFVGRNQTAGGGTLLRLCIQTHDIDV